MHCRDFSWMLTSRSSALPTAVVLSLSLSLSLLVLVVGCGSGGVVGSVVAVVVVRIRNQLPK